MNHNIIMNNINLQFNDNVIITLSTTSFLYKNSSFFQAFDINEDNVINILCPSSYVLDDSNVFYFNNKNDLSFMFTLSTNKFIEICKFLDIIVYNNIDKNFSKQFIEYVMKNIKKEINIIQYFMQPEIRSIMNYINNASNKVSHENEIMCCTPKFYFLYLIKYKEPVIKYNRYDIYESAFNKKKYYRYIHKYDNRLTYNVKETQEYKNYVIDLSNNLILECKKENNITEIKKVVELGANVNYQGEYGFTPLHNASRRYNNFEVIKYLVEQGADVNIKDSWNCAAINEAVYIEDNFEVIKYLVEQGATFKCDKICTPLHGATHKENNIKVIRYIVEHCNNRGEAFKGCNDKVVDVFEENGTQFINAKNKDGYTALYNACKIKNNLEVIQYLIEHGANYKLRYYNSESILHNASELPNNIEVIKYLIELGINVNVQYKYGYTALQNATKLENNLEVIQYLVEHGANIHLQNRDKNSALYNAAKLENNLEVIQYLVEHGADVNIKNWNGWTPLHIAVKLKDNLKVIRYLIEHGANINLQDNDNNTALHHLLYDSDTSNNIKIIQYLIEHGAYVHLKNKDGKTCIDLALRSKNKVIIKCVKQRI